MAEGSGINKTQIWVTVITVIGGLVTALIVNADKWLFREKTKDSAPPSVTTPAEPAPSAPAPSPEPVPAKIDITGEWRSDDGSRFAFTQTGSSYEYIHTAISGTFQSAGKGTISGRDLEHTFEVLTGETGTCTARLNAAANKITGNCINQDGGWSFVIER